MEEIIIRRMQKGDHISISKNIFQKMPIDQIEKNIEKNIQTMKDEKWFFLVAEMENEIVGTMYLEIKAGSLNSHIGELFSVVTSENHRGKGICRKLFEEALSIASTKNLEKIILTVRTNTDAEKVYEKLGFIKYGELPNGIKDDKYHNLSYYYYNL